MTERLTYGMIGGGQGAFIGAVHRMAARLDGEAECVAGALSSTPERAKASGREIGLAHDRNYESWQQMLERERSRPADERVDFVTIVTPNHTHAEIAKAFVEAGFPVACDKPMTASLEQATALRRAVEAADLPFCVTYNYSGYPMVMRARDLVASGTIGPVRKVFIEYHQGWLATPLEREGMKQASWRTDPKLAGAGSLGDIGTHAEHLLSTVGGLEIESLCADVHTFIEGRRVDDDAAILLRLTGGARGVLTCSQVCVGEENGLSLRIYGETGGVIWRQEEPNRLEVTSLDGERRIITRGSAGAGEAEQRRTRLPPGHPEGFIEAFANIYRGFFAQVRTWRAGGDWRGGGGCPGVREGERGVRFVAAALDSARQGGAWVAMDEAANGSG